MSFSFTNTPPPELVPLSLHDALPISLVVGAAELVGRGIPRHLIQSHEQHLPLDTQAVRAGDDRGRDRKSTRLNSSHRCISYAVFCLKKKKAENMHTPACYMVLTASDT